MERRQIWWERSKSIIRLLFGASFRTHVIANMFSHVLHGVTSSSGSARTEKDLMVL